MGNPRNVIISGWIICFMIVALTDARSQDSIKAPIPGREELAAAPSRFSVSQEQLRPIGPFPSWANAKTQYGAKGDGIADDTSALQRAIDDLGRPNKPFVLFIPQGIYRITKTLSVTAQWYYQGLEIVGEDPANTVILWGGPANGTMLVTNGGFNTRFSRITWNGGGTAAYGVAHWWNRATNPKYFGASYEHSDEVFEDMGVGIMAGRQGVQYGALDSEGQVRRVTFIRNTRAGLSTGSWNALDWWIWDSHFIDCARGVTNRLSVDDSGPTEGAGGFYIYRSLFERSRIADVNIKNTQWFSMHDNVSIGSRRFFQADEVGQNAARIIIQGNRIIDTTDPIAISVSNLGPVILLDNDIRSRLGAHGPAVKLAMRSGTADMLSVGNRFSVQQPIASEDSSSRVISLEDHVVARDSLSDVAPKLPGVSVWEHQQVLEVASGSTAAEIQGAIYKAASGAKSTNVVHFAPGYYYLDKTLVVPARARIVMAGDGWGARFVWSNRDAASGPMLRLDGPSYATLQDLQFIGDNVDAISISGADQRGGRVIVIGCSLGPVKASNLRFTALEFQANPGISQLSVSRVGSAVFMGTGGIGAVRVEASNVLISDTWYEGSESDLYRIKSGRFTYLGGQLTPADPNHPGALTPNHPAILLDDFHGTAAFIGFGLGLAGVRSGVGVQIRAESPETRALFIGSGDRPKYFRRSEKGGAVALFMSRQRTSDGKSVPMVDQGTTNSAFVLNGLEQARSLHWDSRPYEAPTGATDVRLYRIRARQVAGGVLVDGQ